MANKRNGTLYTGVTSNIVQRGYQHKQSAVPGFTNQYGCKCLVYYEQYDDVYTAISREKQIKGGSRKKKLALIASIRAKTGRIYMKPCFKKTGLLRHYMHVFYAPIYLLFLYGLLPFPCAENCVD